MRITGFVALTALVLVTASCDSNRNPGVGASDPPNGMPSAPPGQAMVISSPQVKLTDGPVRGVYFPELNDLVASPQGGILTVSDRAVDPLRIISPSGDVSNFNSPSPESAGNDRAALTDSRSAVWQTDDSLLIYETGGELSKLETTGPLTPVGKIAVSNKDYELPAKLVRGPDGRTLLVADGRLWQISVAPKFTAEEIDVPHINEPIYSAITSSDSLYVATKNKLIAINKTQQLQHTVPLDDLGRPEKLASREDGGVWLVTAKGELVEIDGTGAKHVRIPTRKSASCRDDRQSSAPKLTLDAPTGILQRGNQLYFADTGLGCQWLIAVGLPLR